VRLFGGALSRAPCLPEKPQSLVCDPRIQEVPSRSSIRIFRSHDRDEEEIIETEQRCQPGVSSKPHERIFIL
jgi:hypothetical protein